MIYDMHTHTNFSHDSNLKPEESVIAAIQKGIAGIAFTDHADSWYFERMNTAENIMASAAAARMLNDRYGDQIKVFCGIELANIERCPEVMKRLVDAVNPDVVIGSVHFVDCECFSDAYSLLPPGRNDLFSSEQLGEIMDNYFCQLIRMAREDDFDILAHITCPLRYINGKYDRYFTEEELEKPIREILDAIIDRDIALEVNTSGSEGRTMASDTVLRWYKDMGGRLVSLGSDTHTLARVGAGLSDAADMLKNIGFKSCVYYEKRRAFEYGI